MQPCILLRATFEQKKLGMDVSVSAETIATIRNSSGGAPSRPVISIYNDGIKFRVVSGSNAAIVVGANWLLSAFEIEISELLAFRKNNFFRL